MPDERKKGKVIVIVAPSGSGKTTIANMLLEEFERIKFSTSATTRKPRKGEQNGREYYFLSDREFQKKVEEGGFLEWEEYSGNRYGTLQSEVDKLVESGYFPLLDIEVKGALNVQEIYGPDCVTIFIKPPSLEELKRRLIGRESETEETIKSRLEIARKEMKYADRFDHVVVNDDLQEAYRRVKEIVTRFIH